MKFYIWKMPSGAWRFSNLSNIGGEADTWREVYDEAYDLAKLAWVGTVLR